MEADAIVEGFCSSEELYGLRYKCFIADGDSSVHSKLIEKVPYGREIKKNRMCKPCHKELRKTVA